MEKNRLKKEKQDEEAKKKKEEEQARMDKYKRVSFIYKHSSPLKCSKARTWPTTPKN